MPGKCCGCPLVVKPKSSRRGKTAKHHNEEQTMYFNSANVIGYKYDYLFPSNTVDAAGYHFQ
jgi:pyruvate/2-oxoglutarate/acetoin dehydrogenase E1 component